MNNNRQLSDQMKWTVDIANKSLLVNSVTRLFHLNYEFDINVLLTAQLIFHCHLKIFNFWFNFTSFPMVQFKSRHQNSSANNKHNKKVFGWNSLEKVFLQDEEEKNSKWEKEMEIHFFDFVTRATVLVANASKSIHIIWSFPHYANVFMICLPATANKYISFTKMQMPLNVRY